MQSSRSLNVIHTRRLHGRHGSHHLSTGSLPDIRSGSFSFDPPPSANPHSSKRLSGIENSNSGSSSLTWPVQPQDRNSLWLRTLKNGANWNIWRILFVAYLTASLCVLTNDLLQRFKFTYAWTADDRRVMSKILPYVSVPSHNSLKVFLSRDQAPFKMRRTPMEITACVVAEESELTRLDEWSARWNGPVSLVVTTTHPSNSHQYNLLARRISMMGSLKSHWFLSNILPGATSARSNSLGNRIAAHLLSVPFPSHIVPNTNKLLNLARIYSKPGAVVLFPLGLAHPPAFTLHDEMLVSNLGSNPVIIPRLPCAYNSTLIATSPRSKSPPMSLIDPGSSLFMMRDDRIWCPERFLSTSAPVKESGTSDDAFHASMPGEWVECLWRVLLEHPKSLRFSGAGSGSAFHQPRGSKLIAWSDGTRDVTSGRNVQGPDDIHMRVHESASSQYRSEACMLVARQFAAQGLWHIDSLQRHNDIEPDGETRNTQETIEKVMHVRKMCEDTLKLWSRYLLEK